jgi:hypothetical protein
MIMRTMTIAYAVLIAGGLIYMFTLAVLGR